MKTAIRRMGNSHGVIIPKVMLSEIGASADDPVDIKVRKGRIVIEPLKREARAGWAEASKAVHDAGNDRLVWPDARTGGDGT